MTTLETRALTALADWRLKDFDPGAGVAARAFDDPADGADWIDCPAPGDTYLALAAAGRLPDPFADRAEADCAWVVEREWWQRADFDAPAPAPGQRLTLVFEGLDTFATVWLNGEAIATSRNMFRPLRLDLTGRVRAGRNRLAVAFDPPSRVLADKQPPVWTRMAASLAVSKRNLVRKAQFGWGWDWGPTLPTVGVWKPARLEVETHARLANVAFTTRELSADRAGAKVAVSVEAEAFAAAKPLSARIVLKAPDGTTAAERETALADGRAEAVFDLAGPKLWWTPELGAPDLYTLTVSLLEAGERLDERTLRVGVRTIAIDQSPDPDEPGATFFRFVLNGVPIFAKGACWIPCSSFVGAVDSDHYRRLIERTHDANMNMLRIWGGGVYEHDAFYDICDELGVLVWQDFMFACAPYPEDDPVFAAEVEGEARAQVERLRHHACLALWCGNNECQVMQAADNARNRTNAPLLGALYYDDILPRVCAELDPTTPYWPGSPDGGPSPNSMIAGDVHDWTVWHGAPPIPVDRPVGRYSLEPEAVAYTRYAEDMARFVSEYGLQASPAMETLKRALPEGERTLGGEALQARIKDVPKDKVNSMLIPVTGLPGDLEEYVDFTQLTQAEGMKFAIEHFRRRKPHCSGSLIWQLNDCWPGISWSLVDYYGFGKASYYFARRAYAPVMASFKPDADGRMELWVVNDTLAPVRERARISLSSFAGRTHWRAEADIDVGPNQSRCVWRGEAAGGPGDVLRVESGAFAANRHFFAPIKDLDRGPPAAPDVVIAQRGANALAVDLRAGDYLYFTHLLCADEDVRYSDNYFDLAAGERREILVESPGRAIAPSDLTLRWR